MNHSLYATVPNAIFAVLQIVFILKGQNKIFPYLLIPIICSRRIKNHVFSLIGDYFISNSYEKGLKISAWNLKAIDQ